MKIAEKIRIAFRADASLAIGTGHVMRCLTLAEALREKGADIRFVCRQHEGELGVLIEERGFALRRLAAPRPGEQAAADGPAHASWLAVDWRRDADETLAALDDFRPDWLIVDHYGIDARWESRLRDQADAIMVIDDLADRAHDCDLLLDQNLVALRDERYAGKAPEACKLLLGPSYALLQPDYARLRPRAALREGSLRRLLVSFGGVDKDGLTLQTVEALLALDRPEMSADIVLSASAPHYAQVATLAENHARLRLHERLPSLAPLMLEADLAIGAAGATSWERLCLGLPSLVVSLAENQRPIANELARSGFVIWLGHCNEVGAAEIGRALEELATTGLDGAWSARCLGVVDGRGVERVVNAVMEAMNSAEKVQERSL
ncbi:hypothetical protein NA2_18480 [Nitratireductor pacificus pht-3B]|uniref:Pseudaminic acid biosynthesis-associated protein PseG n=2 Tax=Nitratireductor TaxID=245876 RepID=K2M5G9_9HYPH|nr:hypothetical protein NA2_18480 [Nitratireductor pacificus pht-3B]